MKRGNIIIGIVIGVLVLAVVGLLIAWMVGGHGYVYGPAMMGHWQRGGEIWGSRIGAPIGMGLVCLLGLAAFIALVWLVVSLVRGRGAEAPKEPLPREESALEILKRRYARGEISQEEYERIKQELG